MRPMHWNESRRGLRTRTNMRLLRQLEFAFEEFATRLVERNDTVEQALRQPACQTATEAVALQLRGRDATLEREARELLRSLGAKRIATEIRVACDQRLKTTTGRAG